MITKKQLMGLQATIIRRPPICGRNRLSTRRAEHTKILESPISSYTIYLMKIGLIGGTFDPPHIGHLIIAEQARTQLGLDSVWFAPVGQPPHKDVQSVSETVHRVEMTRLAIRHNPHFILSLADVNRPTPHYITHLFEILVRQYPQVEWYLIAGSDSLLHLPNWFESRRLLQLTRLAVAQRPGFSPDLASIELVLPGVRERVAWIDSPPIDLASHDLQRRVRTGLSLRYMVPDEVLCYITAQHLYTSDPA
jgi:nicotinate-nucleotide adenylyltransferase